MLISVKSPANAEYRVYCLHSTLDARFLLLGTSINGM